MTSSNPTKLFIVDTNVILHDSSCLYNFAEHDILLPITVLEELDGFKKGQQIINYHARQFLRALDELSSDHLFNGGVPIGEGLGSIAIRLERPFHKDLESFPEHGKSDHRILNLAYCLSLENREREVILVSKDVNLRMKARALKLPAEDYITDHINRPDTPWTGNRTVTGLSEETMSHLFTSGRLEQQELGPQEAFTANEYMVLKNCTTSALAVFKSESDTVRRIDKFSAYGIVPRNAEQTFALHALLDPAVPLVTVTGKAGTGKTLLALAAALEVRSLYQQILLTRPIVPLSNKDIGYLPGDIDSKIGPYMQPLYDNLGVIKGQFKDNSTMATALQRMLEEHKLNIEPLAYIRGRSLVKKYMIVDEAQNLTPLEVKTIITRAGEGTKIVFTGDVMQIDHPWLDSNSNGLSSLVERMKGQPLYAHIHLRKGERSELAELASDLL